MIINNSIKNQMKILIDIEDLKDSDVTLEDWLISPEKNLCKLFKNIPVFENISITQFYVYSYKFILFYIFLKY